MFIETQKYRLRKISIAALFIYTFLLASISFHHHPFEINLKSNKSFGLHSEAELNNAALTCPIVHFAQNSFQSLLVADFYSFDIQLVNSISIEPAHFYSSTTNLYHNLRAPPLNI